MPHLLLQQLVTPQEARLLQDEFTDILTTEFQVSSGEKNPLEEILRSKVRIDVSQKVREIFASSSEKGYGTIKALSKELTRIPILEISLAYQPNWDQLQELHEWFVREFNTPLLLHTRYQPSLLAGIQIAWQGEFMDLSLQSDLVNTVKRKWQVGRTQHS